MAGTLKLSAKEVADLKGILASLSKKPNAGRLDELECLSHEHRNSGARGQRRSVRREQQEQRRSARQQRRDEPRRGESRRGEQRRGGSGSEPRRDRRSEGERSTGSNEDLTRRQTVRRPNPQLAAGREQLMEGLYQVLLDRDLHRGDVAGLSTSELERPFRVTDRSTKSRKVVVLELEGHVTNMGEVTRALDPIVFDTRAPGHGVIGNLANALAGLSMSTPRHTPSYVLDLRPLVYVSRKMAFEVIMRYFPLIEPREVSRRPKLCVVKSRSAVCNASIEDAFFTCPLDLSRFDVAYLERGRDIQAFMDAK